jgi:chromosome segregation ATPase
MSIYLLLSTRQIIGRPVKITDNDYRVTYDSKIDRDICLDHDIDYIKVQNLTPKKDVERLNEFKDVSLTTAAAVTAYARVYMSKLKKDMSKLKKDMSKLKKDMSKLKKDMSKLKKDMSKLKKDILN